jgi:hypothetical protein
VVLEQREHKPQFFQRGGGRRTHFTHMAHSSLLPNVHALEEHDLLSEIPLVYHVEKDIQEA